MYLRGEHPVVSMGAAVLWGPSGEPVTRCPRYGQGFLTTLWRMGLWDSKAGFSPEMFTHCSGNQHLMLEENAPFMVLLKFLLKFLAPWPGGSAGWSIVLYTKKVAGLIPDQDTYLDCGFEPWSGHIQEATDLFLTWMFLSLKKKKNQLKNIFLAED